MKTQVILLIASAMIPAPVFAQENEVHANFERLIGKVKNHKNVTIARVDQTGTLQIDSVENRLSKEKIVETDSAFRPKKRLIFSDNKKPHR